MSDINFKDNIKDNNITITSCGLQLNCNGCIYQTPSAVYLKPYPCNNCSRHYKDYYESTAVPLKNDNK